MDFFHLDLIIDYGYCTFVIVECADFILIICEIRVDILICRHSKKITCSWYVFDNDDMNSSKRI